MPVTFTYCRLCPQRLGTTPRALLIDLSQRIHEHRPQPGLWPHGRADNAILDEHLATGWLCLYCVEAGAEDAA